MRKVGKKEIKYLQDVYSYNSLDGYRITKQKLW